MLKHLKLIGILAILLLSTAIIYADDDAGVRKVSNLDIDIWVNKGDQATYYYGEDLAIYFQASNDCYVVIYDIDPSGNVSQLFPEDYNRDCFVQGNQIYRIPGKDDNYRLEVSGPSGTEYIYAVASENYIESPDFISRASYDYGNWDGYDNDFIRTYSGDRSEFVARLNDRIAKGPYVQANTMFHIDDAYRHARWYRHWDNDPYYVGSVWIGSDWPGCEVWIDGVYFGISPILIPEIYYGRHWVWLYYNGYPCWDNYFYVNSGQRCYVDAKIDRDHGRRGYDGPGYGGKAGDGKIRRWDLKQDKFRNESDFRQGSVKHSADQPKHTAQPPTWVRDKYTSRGGKSDESRVIDNSKNLGHTIDTFKPGDEAKRIDKNYSTNKNDSKQETRSIDSRGIKNDSQRETRPIDNRGIKRVEDSSRAPSHETITKEPTKYIQPESNREQKITQPSKSSSDEPRKIEKAPEQKNEQPQQINREPVKTQSDSPKQTRDSDSGKRGKR
jgi:hypothetical protein